MKGLPILLFVLCFAGKLAAQQSLFFPGSSFPASKGISLFHTKANSNPITLKVGPEKHVAFFCKMEDKLYSKLNVWIKFRAGSDDIYRSMIAPAYKN